MDIETVEDLIELRYEQIREGATEAIRWQVAWLRRHRFPVWVCDENGNIVDVSERESPDEDEAR